VYLKAWDEHDHHSVVLRQAETPGMDYYGFKVDSKATLDELAKAFSGFGCKVESIFQPVSTGRPANEFGSRHRPATILKYTQKRNRSVMASRYAIPIPGLRVSRAWPEWRGG